MLRSARNYSMSEVSLSCGLRCPEPTLTVQSERDEVDINTIVRRFGLTGVMPKNPRVPTYGDFTDIHDYRTALDVIREADAAFMELTPDVRERFANDPQRLMDFIGDVKNRDEAKKLGLLRPDQEVPLPLKVEVVAGAVPAPGVPASDVKSDAVKK